MGQPEQGRFDEPLDVSLDRTIQGAVTCGGTIRAGRTLVVQGVVSGHFVIEVDAILTVQGTFSGTLDNAGLVMVAGIFSGDLASAGQLALAAGTILDEAGEIGGRVLRSSGILEALVDGEPGQVNANSADYLV